MNNKPMDRFSYSRNGVQGRVDKNCLVRLTIPSVDTTSGKHVQYRVRMVNLQTRQVWEVSRRFSEFFQLRGELVAYLAAADKKCPGCVNYEKVLLQFDFPRKHVFTSDSPVVVKYRRNALTAFVALLASHTFTSSPKCPTCSGFAFTGVRDFLTEGLVVMDGQALTSPVAGDDKQAVARDTIRETMNVKDFTDYHPVASLRQVNSDGKFKTEVRIKSHSPKASTRHHHHHQKGQAAKAGTVKHSTAKSDSKTKQQPVASSPPPAKARESLSSTGSSGSDPSSPGSLPPPSPQQVATKTSAKSLAYSEEEKEEEDEGFSSFTVPQSTVDKREKKVEADATAAKPAKKRFHFTSSPRESMDRESTINFDDEDDEEGQDQDEDINLDFMKSVSVAKA